MPFKKLLALLRGAGQPCQAAATDVANRLKAAAGGDLLSVTLHGSAATDQFVEGASDINLLVVLDKMNLGLAAKLREASKSWRRDSRVQISYFTKDELAKAAEALPMQFLDVIDQRRVLVGEDPFKTLQLGHKLLRNQVEMELRGKAYSWRSRLCSAQDSELPDLLGRCATGLMPVLRGLIRLRNRRPARERYRVVDEASRLFELRRSTFDLALALRYGGRKVPDVIHLRDAMMAELMILAMVADKMDANGHVDPAQLRRAAQELRPAEREVPKHENARREERHPRRDGREGRDNAQGGGEPRREGRDGRDGGRHGRGHEQGRSHEQGRGGERNENRNRDDQKKREKQLTEVRQLMEQVEQKKKWEPKEPERFGGDAMSRDTSRPAESRFGWDRAAIRESGDKPVANAAENFGWDKDFRSRERRERLARRQQTQGGPGEPLPGEKLSSAPAAPAAQAAPAAEPQPVSVPASQPVTAPVFEPVNVPRAPRPAHEARPQESRAHEARPQKTLPVDALPEEKFNR